MKAKYWIATLALLLTACAARQTPTQNPLSGLLATFRSEVNSDPRLDPIRDKVALVDAREVTLPMLSLTTVPTEEEKRALEEWQGMSRSWQLSVNEVLRRSSAWAIPILEVSRAASLTLLAGLYNGNISYGQYNQRRLDLVTRANQTLQAREQELRYQQAQVEAQQSMARSAAISTYQNYLLQQELINQQFQPARIAPFSCTRFGNTTSCY